LETQDTIPGGNFPLTQKQLTSTTLVQLEAEMALSKQVVTQVETPLKLGYWAELVVLALVLDELLVRDVVAVALTLRDKDNVEEEKNGRGSKCWAVTYC